MSTRAQRHQNDGDKDAAAPAIASNVLTAVTKSMMTAIANATIPVATTPKTITYFSAIDPYDKKSFETKTKEGKYWWHLITKNAEG